MEEEFEEEEYEVAVKDDEERYREVISLVLGLLEEIAALSFSEGINGGRIGLWRPLLGFLAATMAAACWGGEGAVTAGIWSGLISREVTSPGGSPESGGAPAAGAGEAR